MKENLAVFEDRRKQLIEQYPQWERLTIGQRLNKTCKKFGDREYIYTSSRSYTYNQVRKQSDLIAKGLIKLGIKNREHVALVMANYPEFIFLNYGIAKAGAVKIPINYRLLENELAYILEQSETACLIIMDRFRDFDYIHMLKNICPEVMQGAPSSRFPHLRNIVLYPTSSDNVDITKNEDINKGVIRFEEVQKLGEEVDDKELEAIENKVKYPDEISDILYTSGTTSTPKGVLLSHDMLWRSAYGSCLNRAFEDGRKIFIPIPFYHVFAYVEGILASCFVGGKIILQPAFQDKEALQLIENTQANDVLCVPAIACSLINCEDLSDYDLTNLRAMYCAGDPAPLSVWESIQNKLGLTELNTGYGMTEVCGGSMQTPPGTSLEKIATRVGKQMPGGCSGLPEFDFKHLEYKVIDPFTGEELPEGKEGEWVCRGNILARGYYNKPLETSEAYDKDGWFRTGDVGIIHSDGFFELTGRSKDMYRIGSENVSPKEIETVIEKHPKVYRASVVGVPDVKMGEVGMAYIELENDIKCDEAEIKDYCKKKMAQFKVPKYVKFLCESEFPWTTSGKIRKVELRDRAIKEMNLPDKDSQGEC